MTVFWIAAVVMVVVALLLVALPLLRKPKTVVVPESGTNVALYREQQHDLDRDLNTGTLSAEGHAQARSELESRLAEELEAAAPPPARRGHAVIAGVTIASVPVLAVVLYALLGTPQGLNPPAADPAQAVSPEQVERMIEKLAQRMKAEPGDPVGWGLLGRTYMALERYAEASDAFAQAEKLTPTDAQLLADYADALAMKQGRKLAGEPRRLIERALKVDPESFKVLALAGSAAFEAGEYAIAVKHWERIAQALPPDSEMKQSVAASIADARARAGGKPAEKPTVAATGGAVIRGTVRLSTALAAQASPEDAVFVFARALEGPRAPLAVRRYRVKDLPVAFVLDESVAMAPNLTLAQFKTVVVGARVAKSGGPVAQPGDLEGLRQPVQVGATRIDLVIDTVVQ